MDQIKIGQLIRRLRRARGFTQLQLADSLGVSDKAVSKWERGLGCPDVSLLLELAAALGVEPGVLLTGELETNALIGGNMKKLKFFVCPECGNLITATGDASVSCCGRRLEALAPRKAEGDERLSVEKVENEYFISSAHEMTKEHYIAFVALLTGDSALVRKQYPEWDLAVRVPQKHGTLVWYCTRHGLMYQYL